MLRTEAKVKKKRCSLGATDNERHKQKNQCGAFMCKGVAYRCQRQNKVSKTFGLWYMLLKADPHFW